MTNPESLSPMQTYPPLQSPDKVSNPCPPPLRFHHSTFDIRHFLFLALCLVPTALHAQWQSVNYSLKAGWNAIYLHGDATQANMADTFAAYPDVQEVWRWVPNPNQVQFTATPLLPTPGTPEWNVWVRGGSANTLSGMAGQSAYLVKCSPTTAANFKVALVQRPMPPTGTWVRNGANLMGFPTKLNGSSYPLFSTYFTTFPAAIATNAKIFKYNGGDLGSTNPVQVFSPSLERLDRNQAYWFDTEVVGTFYAPLQVTLSQAAGMDFGRTGSIVTARVLNRTTSTMTLTIAPVASASAPLGLESISGQVPVTRRTFDAATATWIETPISASYTEVLAPNASKELSFGIKRSSMTGANDAFYASLLRFTDNANLFEINLPVRARKTSLAGLWIGDAQVKKVESKPEANALTATGRSYPLRYILHVADNGTTRLLSQVFLGQLAALPNDIGLCTKESGLKTDAKATASRIVAVHMPLDRVLDDQEPVGSGNVSDGSFTRTIVVPFNDPTNPFVHQYHPDHDNKDAQGNSITEAKIESYTIERQVTFTFTASPPAGSSVTTGWGSSVIGGTYAEIVKGMHKDDLHVTGTFELRRAAEIGSLTLTP